MLFKCKFITKYLFFVLITLCSGQQYFSPLIPNNYFIPNAADLAKGAIFSGPFSDNIFKFYSVDKLVCFRILKHALNSEIEDIDISNCSLEDIFKGIEIDND